MKRVQTALCLLFLFATACGGSSSETPMPLEPVPHSEPKRGSPASDEAGTQDAQAGDKVGPESSASEGDSAPPSENSDE